MSIEEQLAYRFRHSDDARVRDEILKLLKARKFKRATKAQQEAAYKRQQKFSLAEKRLAAARAAEKLTARLRKSVTPGSTMERKLASSENSAANILTNLLEQVDDDDASQLVALFMKPKPSAQDIRKIASLVSRDARIYRRLASDAKAPLAIDVEPASRTVPFSLPSPHIRNEILGRWEDDLESEYGSEFRDGSQFENKPSEPDEEPEAEMEARVARERQSKSAKRESKWGDDIDAAIDEAIAAEIPVAPALEEFKVAPAKRATRAPTDLAAVRAALRPVGERKAPAKHATLDLSDLAAVRAKLRPASERKAPAKRATLPIISNVESLQGIIEREMQRRARSLRENKNDDEWDDDDEASRRAAKQESKRAKTEDELLAQIRQDLGITRSSIESMESKKGDGAPFGSGRKRLTKKQMQVLKRMGVL